MVVLNSMKLLTTKYNDLIRITDDILRVIEDSGINNGIVNVITKHTTTGIMVNESLECLESDIEDFLKRLVPEDWPYAHARILADYGSTAGNPTGHIKAHVTGNHCHLVISDGQMIKGDAQDIYFCEFDGPAQRTVLIQIIGE